MKHAYPREMSGDAPDLRELFCERNLRTTTKINFKSNYTNGMYIIIELFDIMKNEDRARDYQIYEENLKRLSILNRYKKKPLSEDEEKNERLNFGLDGTNTFISYKDLEKMAQNGEEFFLPPNSEEEGCLSCGNGRFYKGSLHELQKQLQADLKNNPDDEKIAAGLKRIEQEIIAKPHLATPQTTSKLTNESTKLLPLPDTVTNELTDLNDISANKILPNTAPRPKMEPKSSFSEDDEDDDEERTSQKKL